MCGIVGYIGSKQASPVLLEGLERLSYRGYDSAGVAVIGPEGRISVRKAKGRLENLKSLLAQSPVEGVIGIGHTRWATHGEPSDLNAHPHTDVKGGIAVVHNGIIENHESLRRYLESTGARFVSQTDTEVIAHLLNHLYEGDMRRALLRAMGMLEGSYALGVICDQEPDVLYCARNDSPLVIGARDGEGFIASDIPALLSHTRDVIFLQDREIGVLDRRGESACTTPTAKTRQHAVFHVDWDLSSAEKGGYAHYMLKEIHEQPTALQSTFTPRAGTPGEYGWLPVTREEARALRKISIVACGTAYHAGRGGQVCHRAAGARARGGGNRQRIPLPRPHHGGKRAVHRRVAKRRDGRHAGSAARSQAPGRAGDGGVQRGGLDHHARGGGGKHPLHLCGPGDRRGQHQGVHHPGRTDGDAGRGPGGPARADHPGARGAAHGGPFRSCPRKAEQALGVEEQLQRLTSMLSQKRHVFFVGRGLDYALSMEAALKLKEVSYIFSEAYAAGELKHGPIALLKEGRLVVATITQPALLEKTMSNLREVVRARRAGGGRVPRKPRPQGARAGG